MKLLGFEAFWQHFLWLRPGHPVCPQFWVCSTFSKRHEVTATSGEALGSVQGVQDTQGQQRLYPREQVGPEQVRHGQDQPEGTPLQLWSRVKEAPLGPGWPFTC